MRIDDHGVPASIAGVRSAPSTRRFLDNAWGTFMRQSAPLFVERPAMGPSAPLSAAERQVRSEAEAAIRTGKGDPFIMGGALRTIRDGRLYRDRCVTFANYCSKEWSLRPSCAYQLMDGSRLIESLKTSTIVEVLPARESQLRPLLRFSRKEGRERVIDFPQVVRVWADVVRRGAGTRWGPEHSRQARQGRSRRVAGGRQTGPAGREVPQAVGQGRKGTPHGVPGPAPRRPAAVFRGPPHDRGRSGEVGMGRRGDTETRGRGRRGDAETGGRGDGGTLMR